MSYLLRNQHRLSSKSVGLGSIHNNNKVPSSLQRSSLSSSSSLGIQQRSSSLLTGGGGGGQIQTQRQHHEQQTQQQCVQGVISMEEVMADLRILEAQQQESERKLQHAKVTKHRRLDYQTALEDKLDKCKYQNGQLAAELQRSQELLSEGHRQLNEARKVSIKAGNDLREYDIKVSNAINIKASIIAHQRTQDLWLHKLHEKVVLIDEVLRKSKLDFQLAKKDFEQAETFERTLRTDIKNENDTQQRIVDQTSKLSTEIAMYEQKVVELSSLQANLKQKIQTMENEEMADLESRRAQLTAILNSLQAEQEKLRDAFNADHDELKTQIKTKIDSLHRLWRDIVTIQKSEGHDQCPLPSKADSLPLLDLDRIRQTLQIELDAVTSERSAKDEIDESIRELGKQLSDLHVRHQGNVEHITELQASNVEATKREESRRSSNEMFLDHYDKIRKDVDEKELLARALQLNHNIEMNELNAELERLTNELDHTNKSCAVYTNKSRDLDDEILSIQATRDKLKESNEIKLLNMRDELERVRSGIASLQAASNSTIPSKHRSTERAAFSVDEQKRRRRHIDEAQKRIAAFLKEYPELERLRFDYRPDLSDHEQALVDLKKFKQKCNARDRKTDAKIAELENKEKLHLKDEVSLPAPEAADKHFKEFSKQEEIIVQESTSKPRALLTTFVRASQSDDKENENDSINNCDKYETSKKSNANTSRTSVQHPDDWTNHSEKKVRWQQDNVNLNEIQKAAKRPDPTKHIETTFNSIQKSKGSLLRQSFGSSDKTKTINSRTKYDIKETSGGKARIISRVARSTTSNPSSNSKSTLELVSKELSSTVKKLSASSDCKKRTSSSRQSSGISSQERSSKLGRRRKRSSQSGGASVGSKSNGHREFDDDEYNFKF